MRVIVVLSEWWCGLCMSTITFTEARYYQYVSANDIRLLICELVSVIRAVNLLII